MRSVRESSKDLSLIFKSYRSLSVPVFFKSLLSCIAFDNFSAKSKKSAFLATKSVSHFILQTVKSVFDELL